MDWLYVGLGGMVGALARYGMTNYGANRWRGPFPKATFLVNASGSFMLGLLVKSPILSTHFGENYLLLLGTGFMGAFTTFSTFTYQNLELLEEGKIGLATAYTLLSILVGVVAFWFGRGINILLT